MTPDPSPAAASPVDPAPVGELTVEEFLAQLPSDPSAFLTAEDRKMLFDMAERDRKRRIAATMRHGRS